MPKAKLLVIDDDSTLLYSVKKSLESDRLTVVQAASAAAGLESFKEEVPDAVLLDLRLHEASGLDVLRTIREQDARIPVIMFTAFSTTSATIEAAQLGAFEYLRKPVDLQELR